jgi:serine/threonine-protein kinase RsbW
LTEPIADLAPPTDLAVTPGPLVGPVLRRVVGMLAARADLPLDRLDDAVLVADVIAERAGPFTDDSIQVRFEPGERRLWMRVGPLQAGGAQALLSEAPDVGSIIVTLADEVQVDSADGHEFLRVCLGYDG